jgi:alpha-methylacyl-CoA racemase
MASARGSPLRRGGETLFGHAAYYRPYRTKDDRFVALGALEPQFFSRFCEVVGRPDLALRQFEGDGRGPLEELGVIFASRTRDEWARLGREHDLCLTAVLEGDEPNDDPQLRSRGTFVEVSTARPGQRFSTALTPVRLDGPRPKTSPAPELGADTEAVLREAGFSELEVLELSQRRVVGLASDPSSASSS